WTDPAIIRRAWTLTTHSPILDGLGQRARMVQYQAHSRHAVSRSHHACWADTAPVLSGSPASSIPARHGHLARAEAASSGRAHATPVLTSWPALVFGGCSS